MHRAAYARYPGCVVMSARRPDEVATLRQTIVAFFQHDLVEDELFLPWSAQQLRAQNSRQLRSAGRTRRRRRFRVRGEQRAIDALREQFGQIRK